MNLSVKRALGIAMPAFAMATFSASPAQASTLQIAASAEATTAALLDSAIAGEIRSPEEKARDIYRKPKETLSFFGLRPDMTVIEVSPGGGWWTDILAPVLREKGKLKIGINTDINGPARRSIGATLTRLAEKPAVFDKVDVIHYAPAQGAKLGDDNSADMILVMRHLHGLIGSNLAPKAMEVYFNALKPGGILAVEQHRWPDALPYPAKQAQWGYENNGYIKEADIIKLAETAGFRLAGKSEINANPKDGRDHPYGVWSLKPNLRGGDADRAKYEAIGESDRMTLKFIKPAN